MFEKIPDGIAIIFAAKGQHYPVKFRQSPDFYYLTGIEEPGAVLVMLGPTKASFLFAPQRSQPQIRADGPGIWQLDKREEVYGLTRVQPIDEFFSMLPFWAPRVKKLYMFSGSQGNVQNAREELDYYELPGHCYKDAGGRCHCKDAIIIIVEEEAPPPEDGGTN